MREKELHVLRLSTGNIYDGWGKMRRKIHVEKNDRNFLINSNSVNVTTSVDIFNYIFEKEVHQAKKLYKDFLVEFKKNCDWFKKSKYICYEINETDPKNMALQVDNYWTEEKNAIRFITWTVKHSKLR